MPKTNKKKKVTAQGQFAKYQGVTILSKVSTASFYPLLELYETLASNPLILSHFVLTPPSSYHMTVNNLYTDDGRANWQEFVDQNLDFFQALAFMLASNQSIAKKGFQVLLNEDFIFGDAIQLKVQLSEELKREFFAFGNMFNIQEGIPSIFHITLGYRYKDFTVNDGYEIHTSIQNSLKKIRGTTLEFSAPTLCYFKNMEKFILWNGMNNPFKKPSSRSSQLFQTNKRPRDEDNNSVQRPAKRYKKSLD